MTRTPVLVTELEYRKGGQVFCEYTDVAFESAPIDEEPLAARIRERGARAVVVGVNRYQGSLYAALAETGRQGGSLIARFGVGHDGIDKVQARRFGIALTNTPGALDASVAELTLWLIGALVRNVARCDAATRQGVFTPIVGSEVEGKVLGLLGVGGIGRRVARMAHFGLGMKVIAAGRRPLAECAAQAGQTADQWLASIGLSEYSSETDSVLRAADILSVHLPHNADTEQFINRQRLARMRPGSLFINTARGGLVDEDALYDALSEGHLAGAALDVYRNEPYVPQSPGKDLRRLASVVLTPHIGSNTTAANARMAEACLRNIRDFFAGRLDSTRRIC